MRSYIFCLLVVCTAVPCGAVDIQYALATLDVIAATDTPIESATGYGIVTLVDVLAVDLVWPVPTGSPNVNSCGTGKPEWTRLTNPNGTTVAALGLVVRPDLVWFHTTSPLLSGCYDVATKKQVNTLVDQTIVSAVPDAPTTAALNFHFAWYYGRCGDTPTNQNCVDWKTQLNVMVSRYPGRAQGITAATQAATLITDSNNFLSAACSSQPGGPFC